jgi:hypothetical protein
MEATEEDSLAISTCAEAAAGAATVDGAVAAGASGSARGGHGRPSDKSINQSQFFFDVAIVKYLAAIIFYVISVYYPAANYFRLSYYRDLFCVFFLTCLRTVSVPPVGRFFFDFFWVQMRIFGVC